MAVLISNCSKNGLGFEECETTGGLVKNGVLCGHYKQLLDIISEFFRATARIPVLLNFGSGYLKVLNIFCQTPEFIQ